MLIGFGIAAGLGLASIALIYWLFDVADRLPNFPCGDL